MHNKGTTRPGGLHSSALVLPSCSPLSPFGATAGRPDSSPRRRSVATAALSKTSLLTTFLFSWFGALPGSPNQEKGKIFHASAGATCWPLPHPMVSNGQLRSKLRRSDIFVAPSALDRRAQLRRSGIGRHKHYAAPLGLKPGFAVHRFYKDSAPTELASQPAASLAAKPMSTRCSIRVNADFPGIRHSCQNASARLPASFLFIAAENVNRLRPFVDAVGLR